jgi:hypothetical protein
MQDIGFDVISDLNLSSHDSFNWEGKATSLYCIVAGNVSSDIMTVLQTLAHLGRFYQGVFYTPGILEYETAIDIVSRTEELMSISQSLPKVCMLHQHVVIIDGIAIVGINGWSNVSDALTLENLLPAAARHEDITYLHKAIGKLQKHLDVKKIIVVSNAVPNPNLYFGEGPNVVEDQIPLNVSLDSDTEHKVTHWVFGTYDKGSDTVVSNINYINNPYIKKSPYWAKRITVLV